MSQRLLLSLVLLVPATASADAIMPFDGECPPGLRRGISNHAEACIPIECQADADCGDGAACQTLCTCRAEREFRSNGRVVYPEPRVMEVEIGLCDDSGACGEGTVAERRQCEPTDETPAFDPSLHRWTGVTHEGGSAPSGSGPNGGSCAGCAVPSGHGGPGALLLALLGLAILRRR